MKRLPIPFRPKIQSTASAAPKMAPKSSRSALTNVTSELRSA